jgi:hypothetical protein
MWVEPLSGKAKESHHLRRFRLRRLLKVNIEGAIVAAGQNLKRLIKHNLGMLFSFLKFASSCLNFPQYSGPFQQAGTARDDRFAARQRIKPIPDFFRRDAHRACNRAGHTWPDMRSDNIQNQCLACICHGLCLAYINPWRYNSYFTHGYFRI